MEKRTRFGWLLLIVAVLLWLGIVKAQVRKFSELLLQAKVKSVELASYKQRLSDIEFAKQQGEAIQGTIRALYLAMPKSSQVPEALVMIESLGSSAGVAFGTASVGSPSGNSLPVTLSFTGNLDSVTKFLDGIHNNVRTAIVKDQSVSSDPAGNLTITLQLGLVYQGGS